MRSGHPIRAEMDYDNAVFGRILSHNLTGHPSAQAEFPVLGLAVQQPFPERSVTVVELDGPMCRGGEESNVRLL